MRAMRFKTSTRQWEQLERATIRELSMMLGGDEAKAEAVAKSAKLTRKLESSSFAGHWGATDWAVRVLSVYDREHPTS